MRGAVPFVDVFRGDFLESVHAGYAVIAKSDGEIVESWGDPDQIILPRSSAKMIQALPLMESGAGDALSDERVALACASHNAEPRHISFVSQWLDELGLDPSALRCGPQPPTDQAAAEGLIRRREAPGRIHNNCSGKHTGFLMLSARLGGGPEYIDPEHPVQKAVRATFEEVTGAKSPGHAIDGCSAPNFATTIRAFATAMARFAEAEAGSDVRQTAMVRIRNAMMAHPGLVSGRDHACNHLMSAAAGKAAIKNGAEGVYAAILPGLKLGVAVKIADGASRAAEAAIAAVLAQLGVVDAADPRVAVHLNAEVRNWDGLLTGYVRPGAALMA